MNTADIPSESSDNGENNLEADVDLEHILAVLDGNAPPDPVAAEVAEQMDLFDMRALVRTTLYRFDCPEPADLVLFAQRQLDGFHTGEIAAHLEICPRCVGELAAWRDFQSRTHAPRPTQPQMHGIRWIRAILQPALPSMMPLRGTAAIRQIYATPDWQLAIMIEDEIPPFKRITGQLIPNIELGAVAILYTQELEEDPDQSQPRRSQLDEFGGFNFDHVSSGTYALHVSIRADEQIVVDPLTVTDQSHA